MRSLVERELVTVAELVAAINQQRGIRASPLSPADPTPATGAGGLPAATVVVLGAHPGAGASTVAVALAEALTASSDMAMSPGPVRLFDAASPETSGLICAADRELGADKTGWRLAHRGAVEIRRPSRTVAKPGDLPCLPDLHGGRLVVDAGWSLSELLVGPNPILPLFAHADLVVVGRATVPGARRVELALSQLPRRPVLVAVGARRWPGQVEASFGPLLRAAHRAHPVELVPRDRRLEINGIDGGPLPAAVTAPVSRLLELLNQLSATGSSPAPAHRTKG